MKKTLLTICLAALLACAVFLSQRASVRCMEVPVTQVFAVQSKPTASPCEIYRQRREAQRQAELDALERLSLTSESAAEKLAELIARNEAELAVESALCALDIPEALCAVSADSATICVPQRLSSAQAQAVMELCSHLTGISVQSVFLLDESGYL